MDSKKLNKSQVLKLKKIIKEAIMESLETEIAPNSAGKIIANVGGKTLSITNFTSNPIKITAKEAPGEVIFIDIR